MCLKQTILFQIVCNFFKIKPIFAYFDKIRGWIFIGNSLDGLECLVPPKPKKSKGDNNNAAQKQMSLQRKTITEYDYPRILNNVLRLSIRILGWCPVS